MTQTFNCPFCGHDKVVQVEVARVIHDVRTHAEYSMQAVETECKDCFEHFVTPEQSDENDMRLADAKGQAIGSPSREAIKKLRDDWKITQEVAGALFGGGKVAFCKYEAGSIVPTQAMARLLALAVAGRVSKKDLEQAAAGTLRRRETTTIWSYSSALVNIPPTQRQREQRTNDTGRVGGFSDLLTTSLDAFDEETPNNVLYKTSTAMSSTVLQ